MEVDTKVKRDHGAATALRAFVDGPACLATTHSTIRQKHSHLTMLRSLSVLLFASVSLSHASFSNTFSLLAWSDDAQANLESFRPFAAKGSQDYQISLAQAKGEECIPALIVSAPSFSHDDLALLTPSSTIRRGWNDAQTQLHIPYLGKPSAANLKSLIDRRLGSCDASQTIFKHMKPYSERSMVEKARWIRDLGKYRITPASHQKGTDRIYSQTCSWKRTSKGSQNPT